MRLSSRINADYYGRLAQKPLSSGISGKSGPNVQSGSALQGSLPELQASSKHAAPLLEQRNHLQAIV